MLTTVKNQQLTVHNPVGYPPKVSRKQPAARPTKHHSKTVYQIDIPYDDSGEQLKQVKAR
jgi:hypothetical protein